MGASAHPTDAALRASRRCCSTTGCCRGSSDLTQARPTTSATAIIEGGGSNLTGSPDYNARVVITGDPGSGCSNDQYRQFNTEAFSGPLPGSVGLESGRNILHSCGDHRLDLSLLRSLPFFFHWQLEVRLDFFNVFNAVIFNARNTTLQLVSPTDQRLPTRSSCPTARSIPMRSRTTPVSARPPTPIRGAWCCGRCG